MTKNNDAFNNDNTIENKDDTCIRDVPNKMHYVLFIIICVVAFVGVAFLFYGVVYEFDFMPFNIKTKAGQSDWFSFLASYLGAWGTIILGCVAFMQNRAYKKLSDETDKRSASLQEEIKKLTEQNVKMTEATNKLLNARFFPYISEAMYFGVNISKSHLKNYFDMKKCGYSIAYLNDFNFQNNLSVKDVLDEYKSIIFGFYNDGEKVIRNIRLQSIIFGNKKNLELFMISNSADVLPGHCAICIIASKEDIIDKMKKEGVDELHLKYVMNNVIGEEYAIDVNILRVVDNDSGDEEIHHLISEAYKYNDNYEFEEK